MDSGPGRSECCAAGGAQHTLSGNLERREASGQTQGKKLKRYRQTYPVSYDWDPEMPPWGSGWRGAATLEYGWAVGNQARLTGAL